ncbi:minichromosome maintenance domain-containing protein 2 isoform X2 [Esox lucius]|uniref:minichromosome maintenance domain-containing protein 2 isoform X2 n=1 Tax=Esox lucius TaxID=8010 RepID=UPI00147750F4|nr:minichromosome maintenance domain-containing protein 2 isoform X2 [Esox lucius]
MDTFFSLKESVLSYLDRSGALLQLAEDCKPFNNPQQSEAVYRFCISVNPSDVIELDPVLGDCVLHDPLKATTIFQSVIFLSIKTLCLIEKIQTESQVNVILKFTHLPPFPEYTLDLSEFPRGYGLMRPVAMEGLVIAMTRVTKYSRGARFLCSEEDCPCSTGFRHVRVHTPGATESVTVRSDFRCLLCSSPLKEDVKFRVLGDKQLVELIHIRALDALKAHTPTALRYQSVPMFLRDELCNSMRIGHVYRVLGIPTHVHQWPGVTWSVEANSVQPWEPEYPSTISANFQALLTATAFSPWGFSAIVANSFGSAVVPPGMYNTLKLGLLLSLIQGRESNPDSHQCLDLLALTADTLIVDRLMMYSLGLAGRGVRHPANGEMFAYLSRDEHGAGTANIHAGSALLATGGVCLLGDLGHYRKDKMDALQSALEGRTVSLIIPGKKYGEDADEQISFDVECNFWALADFTAPSKKTPRTDTVVLGSTDMGSIPAQLAETFGLVIRCREADGEQALLAQTVHTLRQAVQPEEPLYPSCIQFTTQDYQELMACAQGIQTELSPGAERMIHGYYMASRRVRTGSGHGAKVSVTSVKLMGISSRYPSQRSISL